MAEKSTKLYRYAITLEYDGSAFSGFQLQPKNYTVQQALEEAIYKRFKEQRRIAGAGRTDAGVHAKGQAAVFDLSKDLQPGRIAAALNSALPKAVRVIKARHVKPDWHPRYKSVHKTYTYLIYDREISSPLWENRAWQIKRKLDIHAMRKAARDLIGYHDFSAFQASGCSADNPVREIHKTTIRRSGALIICCFQGNAFLYHMVRNIVGTLIKIGLGKWAPSEMQNIIKNKNRKYAGPTAPACGLYLEKIKFGRIKKQL